MIISLEDLRGYKLKSKDETFGKVRDVLVEEGTWVGRWIVVDTGDWLLGKKVLLSPLSIGEPNIEDEELSVHLSKEQIESAPALDEHAPVSREYEKTYYDHYDWPYYWTGGSVWGSSVFPSMTVSETDVSDPEPSKTSVPPEARETVLRSGHELTKYRLLVGEDRKGYIEDLKIDTGTWNVRCFQFDTRKWLHGKTLLISPERVKHANWEDHTLLAEFTDEELSNASDNAEHISDTTSFESMDTHIRALIGINQTST